MVSDKKTHTVDRPRIDPETGCPPPGAGRGQVVAAALDDLADQLKQAAGTLRQPDATAVAQWARCDPQSIVDLVMDDLLRRGVKASFGSEADLAGATISAARLLEALGVSPA